MKTKAVTKAGRGKVMRAAGVKANIASLSQEVNGGKVAPLGHVVYWSISAAEVDKAALTAALKATIGEALLPKEPGKQRALRRTIEALEKKELIRRVPVRNDQDIIAFGLTRDVPDEKNITFETEKVGLVRYNKKTDELKFSGSVSSRSEISDLLAHYQEVFTEDELRRITLDCVEANGGILLRPSGGFYFLRSRLAVESLADFLKRFNSELFSLPILNTPEAGTTMAAHVKKALDTDLELIGEKVKELAANPDNAKDSTFRNRLEEFKTIRSKCEIYVDILKFDAAKLEKQIKVLEGEVRDALSGKLEQYPQAEQFPYNGRVEYKGRGKERTGTAGTVVGYFNDKNRGPYVKVLFDKSGAVYPCILSQLTISA